MSLEPDPLLTDRFEAQRPRLTALATRMLGSPAGAEDAVQEAWLRLWGTDAEIDNLGGWLTTVVSRVCLDQLKSRSSQVASLDAGPEESGVPEPVTGAAAGPEDDVLLADSVSAALGVVLDSLAPRERLAFVLHDTFEVPLTQVAEILGVSHDAARQVASRARRKVRGAQTRERASGSVVDAFLSAARNGEFERLLDLLAPDAAISADAAAKALGTPESITGREPVATFFNGSAQSAMLTTYAGQPCAVWQLRGEPKVLFLFEVADDVVTGIRFVADPDQLAAWKAEQGR